MDSAFISALISDVAKPLVDPISCDVTHQAFSGHDAWGAPSYYPATSHKGLLEEKQTKVINFAGVETACHTTLTIFEALTVGPDDLFVLPASDTRPGGQSPKIAAVEGLADKDGVPYLVKISFGPSALVGSK